MDSDKAGLHFIYLNTDGSTSIVKNSAVHDCIGICMKGDNAYHILIDNNVFYKGERYLIWNDNYKDWKITNNLLIGAKNRSYGSPANTHIWDPIVCISMWNRYDPDTDNVDVSYNVA